MADYSINMSPLYDFKTLPPKAAIERSKKEKKICIYKNITHYNLGDFILLKMTKKRYPKNLFFSNMGVQYHHNGCIH